MSRGGCVDAVAGISFCLAGALMNRNEVTLNDWQAAPADVAKTTPVRDLHEVLNAIHVDAASNAPQYLKETEVPYGGE
jgi:hypothetical protein